MSLATSFNALLEWTDQFHRLPFAFLFQFIGVVSVLGMASEHLFRVLGEIVRSYYGFKAQCAASRSEYLRRMGERRKRKDGGEVTNISGAYQRP